MQNTAVQWGSEGSSLRPALEQVGPSEVGPADRDKHSETRHLQPRACLDLSLTLQVLTVASAWCCGLQGSHTHVHDCGTAQGRDLWTWTWTRKLLDLLVIAHRTCWASGPFLPKSHRSMP